jgi:hypothetical protein
MLCNDRGRYHKLVGANLQPPTIPADVNERGNPQSLCDPDRMSGSETGQLQDPVASRATNKLMKPIPDR